MDSSAISFISNSWCLYEQLRGLRKGYGSSCWEVRLDQWEILPNVYLTAYKIGMILQICKTGLCFFSLCFFLTFLYAVSAITMALRDIYISFHITTYHCKSFLRAVNLFGLPLLVLRNATWHRIMYPPCLLALNNILLAAPIVKSRWHGLYLTAKALRLWVFILQLHVTWTR